MRRKGGKETLEYLVEHLFHEDRIIGFQFTGGRTVRGVMDNDNIRFTCSLNKSKKDLVVIDPAESKLKLKILETVFPEKESASGSFYISLNEIRTLQEQFRNLGYEVEEANSLGEWYWFRIHCKVDGILEHVKKLKENINLSI